MKEREVKTILRYPMVFIVEFKVSMHYESCDSKVVKALSKFEGI